MLGPWHPAKSKDDCGLRSHRPTRLTACTKPEKADPLQEFRLSHKLRNFLDRPVHAEIAHNLLALPRRPTSATSLNDVAKRGRGAFFVGRVDASVDGTSMGPTRANAARAETVAA